MSKNFVLTIVVGTALFVGMYLVWTTWINPSAGSRRPTSPPTLLRSSEGRSGEVPSASITIVPVALSKDGIPETLAGLRLTRAMIGPDALAEFAQLHGKGFDLAGGYMAHYGKDEALLWVGQAKTVEAATDMVAQMAQKIGPDNAMFKDLQGLDIGGKTLYSANGQGQQHFFYAVNDKIVWLGANPEIAPDALHSLWSAVK